MNEPIEPEFCWAAFCTFGVPRPFILPSGVRSHAALVREHLGEVWAQDGETPSQGWRRAYRAGWRVIRVKVEASTPLSIGREA
jgi:hypothetical protein